MVSMRGINVAPLSLSLALQTSSRSVTLYSMPLMATARFSAALDLAVSAAALRSATLVTASEVASELAACSRIVAHGLALKAGCCMTAGMRRALLALGVVSPAPCHLFILNSHLLPALLLGQGLGAALTDPSVGLLLPLLWNVVDDTRVALALGHRRLGDGNLASGLGESSGDTVKTTADDLLGLALLAPDVGARIRVQRGAGLDRTQEGLLDFCLLGRLGEVGNLNSQSCSEPYALQLTVTAGAEPGRTCSATCESATAKERLVREAAGACRLEVVAFAARGWGQRALLNVELPTMVVLCVIRGLLGGKLFDLSGGCCWDLG